MKIINVKLWNRISFKLFFIFFILTFSIAAVYLSVSTSYINNLIESDTFERSDFVLHESVIHFDEIIKEVEDFFLISKSNHEVSDLLEIEYDDIFLERIDVENSFMMFINNSDNLQDLHYFDFRGNDLVRIRDRKRIREYTHITESDTYLYELFNSVKNSDAGTISYIGPLNRDGEFFYYAGIGLVDPNMGEVGGILLLGFEINHYLEELKKYTVYGEEVLWIVTDNNLVIKSESNTNVSPNPLEESPNNFLTLKRNVVSNSNDFNFFNIYISISDRIYKDRIGELLDKTRVFSISIVIIITILSFIISMQFTKPLKSLTNTAIAIGEGKLDTNIDITSNSEIGILATHFRLMTNSLLDINQNLEFKVEERTRELEIRNEEVKNFSYIVSHDLKSPLVSISGFANEISYGIEALNSIISDKRSLNESDIEKVKEVLTEDFDESIGFITASVKRMETLVALVLQYSRLGRKEVQVTKVDINSVLDSITKSLSYQITSTNSKVLYSDLPVIDADITSVEQIFGNLVDNALKYLVKDRPGLIKISCIEDTDYYKFIVADNGSGIAENNMGKVFEIFRRGRQIDVEGSGMGLAYVKTLVHKHNGEIWCESELDKGSKFIFTISKKVIGGT